MTRILLATAAVAAALALAACQADAPAPDAGNGDLVANDAIAANDATKAPQQTAFTGADGAALGSVTVTEDAGGLMLAVSATGMPAGKHGIHLHEKGLCEGPKFESAGSHWNTGVGAKSNDLKVLVR